MKVTVDTEEARQAAERLRALKAKNGEALKGVLSGAADAVNASTLQTVRAYFTTSEKAAPVRGILTAVDNASGGMVSKGWRGLMQAIGPAVDEVEQRGAPPPPPRPPLQIRQVSPPRPATPSSRR